MRKSEIRNPKSYILQCIFTFCILGFVFNCYAKEVSILYTGDTHAALYPCHCPKESDGGISRRATLVNKLRNGNPGILLLDSGGSFAGGMLNDYTQNTDLDSQRTVINIKAMGLMRYDAVLVSNEELKFGQDFFDQRAAETKVPFISCDVALKDIPAFIVKDVSGVKVGITGVTGLSSANKAAGINSIDPQAAVKMAVAELKKNNPDIIILLSGLNENDNSSLIKNIPGIDIVISNRSSQKKESLAKTGSTLILKPSWQARRMKKITLRVSGRGIAGYDQEDLRLSSEIADDPQILKILPQCFSDYDCRKKGFTGACKNPGSGSAVCSFSAPVKVGLTVVLPKICRVCDTKPVLDYLKARLPGLEVRNVYYPSAEADELIKTSGAKALPVYLLDKAAAKAANFNDQLKNVFEDKDTFYMVKPAYAGVSYILGREVVKGNLDLFISLFGKNTKASLDSVKDFNPSVHFLIFEKDGAFTAAKGKPEIEESLRSVCVKKYYPASFFDYIGCRAENVDSSWWQDCSDAAAGMDTVKITACARGEEGSRLLKENIRFNREAEVVAGQTYILDNVEAFSVEGVPTKEDLKKVIKK
jgi:hypothetical protein